MKNPMLPGRDLRDLDIRVLWCSLSEHVDYTIETGYDNRAKGACWARRNTRHAHGGFHKR